MTRRTLTYRTTSLTTLRLHRPHVGRGLKAAVVVGAVATLAACGGSNGAGSGPASSTGAHSSGAIATESTSLGTILTDNAGMTLYAFAADSKGKSNCSGSCETYWPPVTESSTPKAPSGVTAKLGTITRSDGSKQLTVDGWPMYTYVGDTAAGDTTGQGTNLSGGLWWVVSTDGHWIKGSGGSSSPSSTSKSPYVRGY
jgi:predicted lipoprotein with Yx(FWY)xxD motif